LATRYTGQRYLGNDHWEPGSLRDQLVQVEQRRATAGQDQATIGDVRSQFRRGLLQRALDRLNDGRQGLLQRFEHFIGVKGEAARYAFGQVTAAHVHFAYFATREGRADFLLDALGR